MFMFNLNNWDLMLFNVWHHHLLLIQDILSNLWSKPYKSFQYSTFFNFQCLRWNLLCKYIRWGLSVMLFYGSLQLEVLSPMIWDGCSFNYKVVENNMILHCMTFILDVFCNKHSSIHQIILFCCIWEFMKATITSWR